MSTPENNPHSEPRGPFFSIFPLILVSFALIRFIGLMNQPVWNDEPLYIDYMQMLDFDFMKYKWMSLSSGVEWKPPLHYWIGSLFVNLSEDPVLSARFATAVVAFIGFAFALRLAWEISSSRAFTAAFGFVSMVNPFYVTYDKTSLTDAWVYSLGTVYFYFLYRSFTSAAERRIPVTAAWFAGTIACGVALMLTKQSGELFPLYSAWVAVAVWLKFGMRGIRPIAVLMAAVVALFFIERTVYSALIPSQFLSLKYLAPGSKAIVFSNEEILALPWSQWATNAGLAFWKTPLNAFGAWSWSGLLLLVAYCLTFVRRSVIPLSVGIGTLVAAALPPILFIKAANMKYFGVNTLFAYAALFSIALFYAAQDLARRFRPVPAGVFVALLAAGANVTAVANLRYFTVSRFDERRTIGDLSGLKECLVRRDCDWSTPVNLEKAVAYFEKEDKAGNSGYILMDPQWGHPASYVALYRYKFPHIVAGEHLHPDLLPRIDEVQRKLREERGFKNVYLLLNGLRERPWPEGRETWSRDFYSGGYCPNKVVIDQGSDRSNILICRYP